MSYTIVLPTVTNAAAVGVAAVSRVATAHPLGAAIVGCTMTGLAAVEGVRLATPAAIQAKSILKDFGVGLRRRIHVWAAEPVQTAQAPYIAAVAAE